MGWEETEAGDVCVRGVECVVRASESPSRFVPANDPAAGRWHALDGPALAGAAGLPADTLLLEVVRGEGRTKAPTPMDVAGGRTRGALAAAPTPTPRTLADVGSVTVSVACHGQYAATWATLAAATGGLAVRAARRR